MGQVGADRFEELVVEGWDAGKTDGRATFGFRVKNQKGDEVIKNGVAEVRA